MENDEKIEGNDEKSQSLTISNIYMLDLLKRIRQYIRDNPNESLSHSLKCALMINAEWRENE